MLGFKLRTPHPLNQLALQIYSGSEDLHTWYQASCSLKRGGCRFLCLCACNNWMWREFVQNPLTSLRDVKGRRFAEWVLEDVFAACSGEALHEALGQLLVWHVFRPPPPSCAKCLWTL